MLGAPPVGARSAAADAHMGNGLDFDLEAGSANAATCTRIEARKLPVKNSRRACHTFSRWVMLVTKTLLS